MSKNIYNIEIFVYYRSCSCNTSTNRHCTIHIKMACSSY